MSEPDRRPNHEPPIWPALLILIVGVAVIAAIAAGLIGRG